MTLKNITIAYTEIGIENLEISDRQLLKEALSACKKAYAPYSNFHVGASLRLKNGEIILGNNQENSAYPSGLCAERVALFSASAKYPGVGIETMVIVAETPNFKLTEPVTPCGACRQVMSEYEKNSNQPMRIILANHEKVWILEGIANLLPLMFYGENLKK